MDKIRSTYVTKKRHPELARQRGMVGRIDAEGFLSRACALLGRDLKKFRESRRIDGEERKDRDILVYLLWERWAFTNAEIGGFFGVSYSAVSHIVRRVKGQLGESKTLQRKRDAINSQIKM